MALFVIIFLLIVIVPDIYIWWMFIRLSGATLLNLLWWLPTIIALASATAWSAGAHNEWLLKTFFVIMLCVGLPKLLFMALSLPGIAVQHWLPALSTAIHLAAIALAVALCGCCIYGFTRGTKRLEIRHETLCFDNLPASFDGYRIIHISDLHVGTFGHDTTFLARLTERINQLSPDAVLFTGDLVNSSPDELTPHIGVLSQIKAHDGIWSVLGNHDYCEYARYDTRDGAARNRARVAEIQRHMGWRLLLNEHETITRNGEVIAVAGVENDGRPPFPSRGNLAQAKAGIADSVFTVLLSHDPTYWRREIVPHRAADLTLSGHTHAMQFELFGLSPSALTYSEWGGLYREGRQVLYVSKGTGGTAPFRFGAWPEITVITLGIAR